jgi:hypothetical protein
MAWMHWLLCAYLVNGNGKHFTAFADRQTKQVLHYNLCNSRLWLLVRLPVLRVTLHVLQWLLMAL